MLAVKVTKQKEWQVIWGYYHDEYDTLKEAVSIGLTVKYYWKSEMFDEIFIPEELMLLADAIGEVTGPILGMNWVEIAGSEEQFSMLLTGLTEELGQVLQEADLGDGAFYDFLPESIDLMMKLDAHFEIDESSSDWYPEQVWELVESAYADEPEVLNWI